MPFTRLRQSLIQPNGSITGSLLGTASYAITSSYAMNGGSGGGSTPVVSVASLNNQTILYNFSSSQEATITGLTLTNNNWGINVVEEWNSGSGDIYYPSCSLLCHFDSINSAGRFIDNSSNNFTITSSGGAGLSTSQYKFGGASAYFDGSGDYLSSPSTSNFAFGTGDFTIECWVYKIAGSETGILQISSTAGGLQSNYNTTLVIYTTTVNNNVGIASNNTNHTSTAFTNTVNTWNHYALVRSSGVTKLYFNGNLVTDIGTSGAITDTTNYTGTYLAIGGYYSTTYLWNGYIDELRITKGIARYTANFTPQSFAFPNSAAQIATKYIGLVGGLNDTNVDYGIEKLSDTSLKIKKLTDTQQPSGSFLSSSVDRVYVNVLNYDNVSISGSISNAVTASYALTSATSVTSSFALSASYLIPTSNNTTKAIFGYGLTSVAVSVTNLVSNTGVVANDTTGVGTARYQLAAAGYSADKAIFGYGTGGASMLSVTNLVSNTGVVATDTTGVGTARVALAAARYGTDKAIFGYGYSSAYVSMTNLVSNTGVVATDTTGVGTVRSNLAAAGYGSDKGIFGYGANSGGNLSITNLVSNTGVVATDTTGVGTARYDLASAGYGNDKAIFGYGYNGSTYYSITNLVSNTGVVATDTTGVGTARQTPAAAGYGGDKSIFGYGSTGTVVSVVNLVSNTGVVANDTLGVGTARRYTAAAGYSTS